MDYRFMGRTGVQVSRLSLGTMMFGGATDEFEAQRIIDHAAEHGVNVIDTANVYQDGRSEEIVGRAVKHDRDRWIVATKVGSDAGAAGTNVGLSRRYILQQLELSLARLRLDYVDIYYVHAPDPHTPLEDTVGTFADLIASGKIRYVGLSNLRAWQIARFVELCRKAGAPDPAIIQPYYNLVNRMPEVEVIPAARNYGLAVTPYSPAARGVLTAKYASLDAPPRESRAGRRDSRMMMSEWRAESLEIARHVADHAGRRGAGPLDFAVAWLLNNAAVTTVLAGPRTLEQWKGYVNALAYQWTSEDEAFADALIPPGHPSTPGYTDPKYPVQGRYPMVAAAG